MVVRMFCSVAGWAQSSAALGSSLLHAARRIVLKINTEAVFLYMGTPEDDGLSDGLTCLCITKALAASKCGKCFSMSDVSAFDDADEAGEDGGVEQVNEERTHHRYNQEGFVKTGQKFG